MQIESAIQQWQAGRYEIGLIEFAPSDSVSDHFPYYSLPDEVQFLGTFEADALCLQPDGTVCLYDHESEKTILCRAAANQLALVSSLQRVEQHFERCLREENYFNDAAAAESVRDQCAEMAGGPEYLQFFSALIGV